MEKSRNTDNYKLSRRQIRIKVMQAIYAKITSECSPVEVFGSMLEHLYLPLYEEDSPTYSAEDAHFMKELFYGTLKNQLSYEDLITAKLQNWEFDRVALVDRIVILMGIHEMLAFHDIPVKVTINEYIEVAKVYSTEKSNKFVNGVLDSLRMQLNEENKILKYGRGLLEKSL